METEAESIAGVAFCQCSIWMILKYLPGQELGERGIIGTTMFLVLHLDWPIPRPRPAGKFVFLWPGEARPSQSSPTRLLNPAFCRHARHCQNRLFLNTLNYETPLLPPLLGQGGVGA